MVVTRMGRMTRMGDDSQNISLTLLHQIRRILRSAATSWTRDLMSNTIIRPGVKCWKSLKKKLKLLMDKRAVACTPARKNESDEIADKTR